MNNRTEIMAKMYCEDCQSYDCDCHLKKKIQELQDKLDYYRLILKVTKEEMDMCVPLFVCCPDGSRKCVDSKEWIDSPDEVCSFSTFLEKKYTC